MTPLTALMWGEGGERQQAEQRVWCQGWLKGAVTHSLWGLTGSRGGEVSRCSLVQISKDPAAGPARENSNGGSSGSRRGLVAEAGTGLFPQGKIGQVCVTAAILG